MYKVTRIEVIRIFGTYNTERVHYKKLLICVTLKNLSPLKQKQNHTDDAKTSHRLESISTESGLWLPLGNESIKGRGILCVKYYT